LRAREHDRGVGLVCYYLLRGDVDTAVEWIARAAAHRSPAFIPVWVRAFGPIFRESAAWPAALQAMNLAEAV